MLLHVADEPSHVLKKRTLLSGVGCAASADFSPPPVLHSHVTGSQVPQWALMHQWMLRLLLLVCLPVVCHHPRRFLSCRLLFEQEWFLRNGDFYLWKDDDYALSS